MAKVSINDDFLAGDKWGKKPQEPSVFVKIRRWKTKWVERILDSYKALCGKDVY